MGVESAEERDKAEENRRLDVLERAVSIVGRRMDLVERTLAHAEALLVHQLTVIAANGSRMGLCKCGWASPCATDIDFIGSDYRRHVSDETQPTLFG